MSIGQSLAPNTTKRTLTYLRKHSSDSFPHDDQDTSTLKHLIHGEAFTLYHLLKTAFPLILST